jgi:hypothetical protein
VRLTLCDGLTQSETRGRPFVAPRAAVPRQVCFSPANLGDLVQLDTQPQRFLFAAPPTPAGTRRVRLTLCDGPTLSETRGRPFVAPRAAVPRQVCFSPANLGNLVELYTQPRRFLFAAPPTPAGNRRVRVTLCDGPTLSETRERPFVAPRASVRRQVCYFPASF